jgi:ferredoxin
MQKAVTEAGGVMRSFHAEGVKPLVCDNETVPIPAWWDEVDCFISIPKLKTHALTSLTCAVKNTYGVVVGLAKAALHAKYPSPNAMSRFLAAIHKALTPRFVLVDGIWAMEGEGPTNGRPKKVGILAASEEAVAVDAVLARLLRGENPKQMALLQAAADGQPEMIEEGNIQLVGDVVPEDLNVTMKPSLGRWLRRIPEPVFIVATRLVACRPVVVQSECKKCGACEQICSKKAVYRDESGAFHVDRAKCIVCMCCMETCPYAAIRIQNPISRVGNMCKRLIGKA